MKAGSDLSSELTAFKPGDLIYEGKAKKILKVLGREDLVWQVFKDSFTAFNGVKKATMEGKGTINCQIATLIYQHLQAQSVPTHFEEFQSPNIMITKKLEMIPLEVVVRNTLAGSTAKKLGFAEGSPLKEPLVEFYYKKDELNDPFISDDQAWLLETVHKREDLSQLKALALKINGHLLSLFSSADLQLVDFKLEFGYDSKGSCILADEISPDSCRIWDPKTGEKMDKDRFRRDLGQVLEKYQEVLDRLRSLGES